MHTRKNIYLFQMLQCDFFYQIFCSWFVPLCPWWRTTFKLMFRCHFLYKLLLVVITFFVLENEKKCQKGDFIGWHTIPIKKESSPSWSIYVLMSLRSPKLFFPNYPLVLHLPIPPHFDEVFFMIFVQTLNVHFFLWQ